MQVNVHLVKAHGADAISAKVGSRYGDCVNITLRENDGPQAGSAELFVDLDAAVKLAEAAIEALNVLTGFDRLVYVLHIERVEEVA